MYPVDVSFVLCLGFCDKRDPLSFVNCRKFKRDKCCLIAHRNETKYGGRWVVGEIFRAKVDVWVATFQAGGAVDGTSNYKRKFSNNLISGNKQQKHFTHTHTHIRTVRTRGKISKEDSKMLAPPLKNAIRSGSKCIAIGKGRRNKQRQWYRTKGGKSVSSWRRQRVGKPGRGVGPKWKAQKTHSNNKLVDERKGNPTKVTRSTKLSKKTTTS